MKKLTTTCVGMQHRLTPSTRRMMKSRIEKDGPIEVLLIREPDNQHDENAVKVQVRKGAYKGLHIAYLMRNVASVYAPALDNLQVHIVSSYLTDVNPDDGTGTVEIKVRKGAQSDFKKSRKET